MYGKWDRKKFYKTNSEKRHFIDCVDCYYNSSNNTCSSSNTYNYKKQSSGECAKEATFKEDVRNFQDELARTVVKE